MHYWIDGYNLLFRITKSYREMKQNERKLLSTLNKSIILLKYQATVVFDGREKDPPEALRRNLDELAMIYTPYNQTADDYILEAIADATNPAHVVVSSDMELLRKAKQRGAKALTVEEFLSQLMRKKNKKKSSLSTEKVFQETSSELKRLLKIFEDRLNEEN